MCGNREHIRDEGARDEEEGCKEQLSRGWICGNIPFTNWSRLIMDSGNNGAGGVYAAEKIINRRQKSVSPGICVIL